MANTSIHAAFERMWQHIVDKFATQTFVTNKIAEAQLNGGDGTEIDLSGYATKDDLSAIDFPVDSVNGKTGTVTLSASDVSAVPTTRKINNKALSADITLSASDVGAASSSHNHAASSITSGTLSSDRLPTVPIDKGGTGATTTAAALTNLGAASVDYAKKVGNLHNILDNSDFSNPVNQREDTAYTGLGYTIDRWRSNSSYTVIAINDGYTLFRSSTNGETAFLQQYIESGIIKSGSTYTVACTLEDGSVHCASGVASTDMSDVICDIYVNNASRGNLYFKYDSSVSLYTVMFSTTSSSTSYIRIANVSLYEDEYTIETLPEYKPKGFAAELLECQRYYYYTSQYTAYPAYRSTTSYAFITLPTKMRIDSPTVMGDFKVRGSLDSEGNATSVTLSHVGYIGFGNTLRLSLIDDNKTDNQVLIFIVEFLEISAELVPDNRVEEE